MWIIKEFLDDVVIFIWNYFFMYNFIYLIYKRFLIVCIGIDYKYIKIVVDWVNVVDGRYYVLFFGIDWGIV